MPDIMRFVVFHSIDSKLRALGQHIKKEKAGPPPRLWF